MVDFLMNLHLCNRYHYQFEEDDENEYMKWCG